ncbi:MAG: KH domain-containing protein [Ferrimicrobium sp.]
MTDETLMESTGEDSSERLSSLLTYLTRKLVRDEGQVVVRSAQNAHGELQMTVTVPPGELGKVIGRGGRTANSIRTVVAAMAIRSGVSTQVEFTDGKKGPRSPRPGGNRSGPRREGRRDDR